MPDEIVIELLLSQKIMVMPLAKVAIIVFNIGKKSEIKCLYKKGTAALIDGIVEKFGFLEVLEIGSNNLMILVMQKPSNFGEEIRVPRALSNVCAKCSTLQACLAEIICRGFFLKN